MEGLFAPDIGGLDDGPPLLDLSALQGGERLRRLLRAWLDLIGKLDQARAHLGLGEDAHHRGIELGDDLSGRALGGPEAVPIRDVESGKTCLVGGRYLRRL